MASSRTVKVGEAARRLGVSIDTIRRWTTAGKLPSLRTPGGTRLYDIADLEEVVPKRQPIASETLPGFVPPAPAGQWFTPRTVEGLGNKRASFVSEKVPVSDQSDNGSFFVPPKNAYYI